MEFRQFLDAMFRERILFLIILGTAFVGGFLVIESTPETFNGQFTIVSYYQDVLESEDGPDYSSGFFKYNNYYGIQVAIEYHNMLSGVLQSESYIKDALSNLDGDYGLIFSVNRLDNFSSEISYNLGSEKEVNQVGEAIYKSLSKLATEMSVTRGEGSIVIRDYDLFVTPSGPPSKLNFILVGIFGVMMAVFAVSLKVYFLHRVYDEKEVDKLLNIDSIGMITKTNLISKKSGRYMVEMAGLREKILTMKDCSSRVVGIVSLSPQYTTWFSARLSDLVSGQQKLRIIDTRQANGVEIKKSIANSEKDELRVVLLSSLLKKSLSDIQDELTDIIVVVPQYSVSRNELESIGRVLSYYDISAYSFLVQ